MVSNLVNQPTGKIWGCKPIQQPGFSQLAVTQARGQATCKLPRSTSTERPPPSGIDVGLSQAKESLPGPGPRENALGLGTPQGSWAGSQGRKPAGCSINQHLEICTQVFLCPHTMLPQAFPSACITQVLLLSGYATPNIMDNGEYIANQWWL